MKYIDTVMTTSPWDFRLEGLHHYSDNDIPCLYEEIIMLKLLFSMETKHKYLCSVDYSFPVLLDWSVDLLLHMERTFLTVNTILIPPSGNGCVVMPILWPLSVRFMDVALWLYHTLFVGIF